ncbi:hypothetical protein [Microvirga aerophila]|uniref:Uncharacterized protein n=1 Tax=Microvirga aerophila TaxID=670291 RepID=A0A512BYV9_9HYPH|nr:hypothetical protein [Microvirga aerophila]GEO17128.1 hypothetical protein MAE02_48240 [Microvirga aerophila]
MTIYKIHAGNSIDKYSTGSSPGLTLKQYDVLRVEADGYIMVRGKYAPAVSSSWNPMGIEVYINGSVVSALGHGIDLAPPHESPGTNYVTVGTTGFVQGDLSNGGIGVRNAFGTITNHGVIVGDIGVQFSQTFYNGPKLLVNTGEINGTSFAIRGSSIYDYVENDGGVINGTVDLRDGNDTFVMKGGRSTSTVFLGRGNDIAAATASYTTPDTAIKSTAVKGTIPSWAA